MKKKFNGMDVFIIIILVAVIAFGGWFLLGRGSSGGGDKDVTVYLTVEFAAQEEGLAERIAVGDSAVIGEKEKAAGTVKSVKAPIAKGMGYNNTEGWAKETEIPERYDVQVVLECKGVDTGDTIELNNNAVRVGAHTAVKSKDWAGYGVILAVEEAE